MALMVQEERFSAVIEEAQPLLELHWEEIALNQDFIALSPNYARYARMEADGKLCIVTVRDNGDLVGYACFIADLNLHYSTILWGELDVIWLAQEHRRNGTGNLLLDAGEKALLERGVCMLHARSKVAHPALAMLLERRGYTHVENTHAKMLQRPE